MRRGFGVWALLVAYSATVVNTAAGNFFQELWCHVVGEWNEPVACYHELIPRQRRHVGLDEGLDLVQDGDPGQVVAPVDLAARAGREGVEAGEGVVLVRVQVCLAAGAPKGDDELLRCVVAQDPAVGVCRGVED